MDYYKFVDGELVLVDEYIQPCKNNGRCQQYEWEKFGHEWIPHWVDENGETHREGIPYGMASLYREGDPLNIRLKFKCCTLCHQPVNSFAAAEINEKIGFELPSVDDLLGNLSDLLGKVVDF